VASQIYYGRAQHCRQVQQDSLPGETRPCDRQWGLFALVVCTAAAGFVLALVFTFWKLARERRDVEVALHIVALLLDGGVLAGQCLSGLVGAGVVSVDETAFIAFSCCFSVLTFTGNIVGLRTMVSVVRSVAGSQKPRGALAASVSA
jgi:hypothetical protein